MNLETLATAGATVLAIFTAITALAYKQGQIAKSVATLEEGYREIRAFLFQRSQVEFVHKGWGAKRSKLEITLDGMSVIEPFLTKFLPFYVDLIAKKPDVEEDELFLAFNAEFGELMRDEVCIPRGVMQGACIIAAIEACKMKLRIHKENKEKTDG